MAGGSNTPKGATGEKKKRKRPSKKVPTTVLDASSENFMTVVQKLTGSAEELENQRSFSSRHSVADTTKSPSSSPYSSPSPHDDVRPSEAFLPHSYFPTNDDSSSYNHTYNPTPYMPSMSISGFDHYGQYNNESGAATSSYNYTQGFVGGHEGGRSGDEGGSSMYERQYSGRDQSDSYRGYGYDHEASQSRAVENDISVSGSYSWRSDQMNHSSDYWYQVDPMPAMRA